MQGDDLVLGRAGLGARGGVLGAAEEVHETGRGSLSQGVFGAPFECAVHREPEVADVVAAAEVLVPEGQGESAGRLRCRDQNGLPARRAVRTGGRGGYPAGPVAELLVSAVLLTGRLARGPAGQVVEPHAHPARVVEQLDVVPVPAARPHMRPARGRDRSQQFDPLGGEGQERTRTGVEQGGEGVQRGIRHARVQGVPVGSLVLPGGQHEAGQRLPVARPHLFHGPEVRPVPKPLTGQPLVQYAARTDGEAAGPDLLDGHGTDAGPRFGVRQKPLGVQDGHVVLTAADLVADGAARSAGVRHGTYDQFGEPGVRVDGFRPAHIPQDTRSARRGGQRGEHQVQVGDPGQDAAAQHQMVAQHRFGGSQPPRGMGRDGPAGAVPAGRRTIQCRSWAKGYVGSDTLRAGRGRTCWSTSASSARPEAQSRPSRSKSPPPPARAPGPGPPALR